ncbi:tyrosine-type recombinase/integrase [Brevibacillus sp. SYSU BS000544]|uniref:tyrosine-type recombinase/integrase n=1 Tax=Brevibacillus sp. SYSU BS000544 TaxID=3416443 RepID=UPI003CE55E38
MKSAQSLFNIKVPNSYRSTESLAKLPPILNMYLFELQTNGKKYNLIMEQKNYLLRLYRFLSQEINVTKIDIDNYFPNLQLENLRNFEQYIDYLIETNKLSGKKKSSILLAVERFINYLHLNNLISFQFKRSPSPRKINDNKREEIIKEFIQDLQMKNYSRIYENEKYVNYFFSIIRHKLNDKSILNLTKAHLIEFEDFLGGRIVRDEITPGYAYQILKSVRLFVRFLNEKKNIKLTYSIAKHLIAHGNRANEYVPKDDVIRLIKTITSFSKGLVERNISIFFLLLETGCRPIEICSMNISDIDVIESTVTLYSKKSGQRKMKIDPFVLNILKQYLKIRLNQNVNNKFLFLTYFGEPLRPNTIGSLFSRINVKAFSKNMYSAKTFRHTYATNALENGNDFNKVSKSIYTGFQLYITYIVHQKD